MGTKTKRNSEMNHFQIDNFRAVVPLRLPGLIEEDGLETIDDYVRLCAANIPAPEAGRHPDRHEQDGG